MARKTCRATRRQTVLYFERPAKASTRQGSLRHTPSDFETLGSLTGFWTVTCPRSLQNPLCESDKQRHRSGTKKGLRRPRIARNPASDRVEADRRQVVYKSPRIPLPPFSAPLAGPRLTCSTAGTPLLHCRRRKISLRDTRDPSCGTPPFGSCHGKTVPKLRLTPFSAMQYSLGVGQQCQTTVFGQARPADRHCAGVGRLPWRIGPSDPPFFREKACDPPPSRTSREPCRML